MSIENGKIEVIIFLFLSLISGFFEIGAVMWAIELTKPVCIIVGVGIMYQLGNLVPVPLIINKKITIVMLTVSLILTMLIGSGMIPEMVFLIVVGLTAGAIQHLRSNMKDKVGTTIKRVFRVLGFLAAPFFSLQTCIIGIVILLMISFIIKEKVSCKPEVLKCRITHINIIMILHQMHYFGYVYFMLIILNKYVTSSNIVIGLLFVVGWITYLVVPHIVVGEKYCRYFICGHIYLSLILLILAINYNSQMAAILWILTGFGGGTVFCIKEINSKLRMCTSRDIVFSENIGHILGAILGLTTFYLFNSLMAPILFSMICAILAVLGMILLLEKDKLKG